MGTFRVRDVGLDEEKTRIAIDAVWWKESLKKISSIVDQTKATPCNTTKTTPNAVTTAISRFIGLSF